MTVLTSTGLILNEFFMQGRNTIQEPRSHATHLGSQIENENHLGIPLITVVVTIFGCYNHGPGGVLHTTMSAISQQERVSSHRFRDREARKEKGDLRGKQSSRRRRRAVEVQGFFWDS